MRLAWPIAISMMSFTLKGFVDMLMVGRLGVDALGAVGIASIATWALITFPWGVLRGQRPLVSQYLGAGKPELALSFGLHALYFALAWGLLLVALSSPLRAVVGLFVGGTELPPDGVDMAQDYVQTRMLWSPPLLCSFALAEYLRSTGRSRLPMAVDLLSHPLNVLFNYGFIYGNFGLPALGAQGAALGTGLADACAFVLMAGLLFAERSRHTSLRDAARLRLSRMAEVAKVGLSGGVQFSLETYAFVAITWIVGQTDPVALAVHQAGIQMIHLSVLPAVAIADAGSVLIGRYVGALRWEDVGRTLRSTLQIVTPFMAGMALLFLIGGRWLIGILVTSEDPVELERALALGVGVMAAAALWQVGDALQVVFRFALRATGDHRWVMLTGILCSWVLSLPLVAWVVFVLDGDVADVWLVWAAEIFVGDAIFVWRWRSGAWKRKRLVRDEPVSPSSAP